MSEIQWLSETKTCTPATQHLIFVHGLGGDSMKTWSVNGHRDKFWPDWLKQTHLDLGLWTVRYDACLTQFLSIGSSGMGLFERSENILEQLLLEPKFQQGKLYFVCHSLGGLIIKQLLRYAAERGCQDFLNRLGGVVFLGTPHLGSLLASLLNSFPLKLLLALGLHQPSLISRALQCRMPYLKDLHTWYGLWVLRNQVPHLNFIESKPVPLWGRVVEKYSAAPLLNVPAIPVDADHGQLCKLTSQESVVYRRLYSFLMAHRDACSAAA
jgi:pimeloyl-ACP methyl ester carboxylesterase